MSFPTLIALVTLLVSPRAGPAPLYANARVEVGRGIQVGSVCLEWRNVPPANESIRRHLLCWSFFPTDQTRVWTEKLLLDGLGTWSFDIDVQGRNAQGTFISVRMPAEDTLTK